MEHAVSKRFLAKRALRPCDQHVHKVVIRPEKEVAMSARSGTNISRRGDTTTQRWSPASAILSFALTILGVTLGPLPSAAASHPDSKVCVSATLIGSSNDAPGQDPCPGIRPGAWISTSRGRCTINFIFSDRSRLFAGTAGHCVKKVGESVSSVSLHDNIGRVAFRIKRGFYRDFALIEIHRKLAEEVDPNACVWGGPTGIAEGPQADYSRILHMGYGYGLGYIPTTDNPQSITYARRGVAPQIEDPRQMHFLGLVSPGDSGSGAYLEDGRALGVITVLGASVSPDGARGVVGGGRLPYLMHLASRRLHRPIYLVTADGALADTTGSLTPLQEVDAS